MQRREAELGSFAVNARPETARIREFGGHVFEIAALSRASLNRYNLRVWVVGGDGDRTCDPLVNEAGSRMIKSEIFVEVPILGGGERPRCGGMGREGQLSNVACPSRSRRVSSAFCRRCPRIAAAATPELRNRTTPAGPSRSLCPSRHPIDVLAEIRSALGSAHAFGNSLWQP